MKVASLKVPVIGFLGVGSGISVGTLAAEFTSRATGQTGWAKTGVNAAVKGGVGIVAYVVSDRISSHSIASFFAEMFAYGSFGAIFADIFMALYPGGITGIADDWAINLRSATAGARRVSATLTALETRGINQPQLMSTRGTVQQQSARTASSIF